MGWLLSFVTAFFVAGNWFHSGNTELAIRHIEEQQRQQQAYEILRLTNAINDWRYHHPGTHEGKTLTVKETGISTVYGTRHIISGQKTFVWLPFQPGLIAALDDITRGSALIAHVKNRKLMDKKGHDTGPALSEIPEGAIVLIN